MAALKWAVQALAQSPETQATLFPSFEAVAEELALAWEEAYSDVPKSRTEIGALQLAKIERLDALLAALSGEANVDLWLDNITFRSSTAWAVVAKAAAEVAEAFGWDLASPPQPYACVYFAIGEDE